MTAVADDERAALHALRFEPATGFRVEKRARPS